MQIKEIGAGTTPSNGAFLDEFSEQIQHQRVEKVPYSMANLYFFVTNDRCVKYKIG